MPQPARSLGPFAHATREALEGTVSRLVAEALLDRALLASGRAAVPEEILAFRGFVEGPLRAELARVLDAAEIAHVLERLGNVLWMATSDVRALSVARDWSATRTSTTPPPTVRESGSHPRMPRGSEPAVVAKRPTMPAPASSPPEGVPSLPRPPRSPLPPRAAVGETVSLRAPRAPVTIQALPRVVARSAPTAILVLSLDARLALQTTSEVAGRCPVITVGSPGDLARATAIGGERLVVLVDTTLPSIDLPTFVALSPILPPTARVILWGADERQRARLVTQFPAARSWLASDDAQAPGMLALSLG